MNYRERRLAKAERLRRWADSREQKAETAHARADRIAGMIPFGQPILVGHHSERRHRRDLDRIDSGMRGWIEHSAKAESFRSRADGIEAAAERSIYSDDQDALPRLQERIAELETERDRIKAYNVTCRRGTPDESLLDEKQRANLATIRAVCSYQLGKNGAYPSYALSNLNGNIARNRKRLADLTARVP